MNIVYRINFCSALHRSTLAVKIIIMKRILLLAGLFFSLMLLNGCLTTLHPIFTEKDLVFDPRLIGNWEKSKDSSTAHYRQASSDDVEELSPSLKRNAARIYIREEKEKGAQGKAKSTSYAFLVKLGKYYYLTNLFQD